MNSLQRNLWILVTVSAMAIIFQHTFSRMMMRSDISQISHSCQKVEKKKKRSCTTTYTSCNDDYVKLKRMERRCNSFSYSYSSKRYPHVDAFVAVDKLPAAINFSKISSDITYPAYAKEKGIEGVVIARILVDEQGKYVRHKILKYDNCGMRFNVEKKLSKLQFQPAEKDGEPVAIWVNLPFKFSLN